MKATNVGTALPFNLQFTDWDSGTYPAKGFVQDRESSFLVESIVVENTRLGWLPWNIVDVKVTFVVVPDALQIVPASLVTSTVCMLGRLSSAAFKFAGLLPALTVTGPALPK